MSQNSTIVLSDSIIASILQYTDLTTTNRLAKIADLSENNNLWRAKCLIERKGLIGDNIKVTDWKSYYRQITKHYGGDVVVSNSFGKIKFDNPVGSVDGFDDIVWLLDEYGKLYSLYTTDRNLVWTAQAIPDKVDHLFVDSANQSNSAIVITSDGKCYLCGSYNRYNNHLFNTFDYPELPQTAIVDIGYDNNKLFILYPSGTVYEINIKTLKLKKMKGRYISIMRNGSLAFITEGGNVLLVRKIDIDGGKIETYDGTYDVDFNEADRFARFGNSLYTLAFTSTKKNLPGYVEPPEPEDEERLLPNRNRFTRTHIGDEELYYDQDTFYDIKSEEEQGLRDIRDNQDVY